MRFPDVFLCRAWGVALKTLADGQTTGPWTAVWCVCSRTEWKELCMAQTDSFCKCVFFTFVFAVLQHVMLLWLKRQHIPHTFHIWNVLLGLFKLEWVFEAFDNSHCPLLQNKPKMFFIQACRGGKTCGIVWLLLLFLNVLQSVFVYICNIIIANQPENRHVQTFAVVTQVG